MYKDKNRKKDRMGEEGLNRERKKEDGSGERRAREGEFWHRC